MVQGTRTRDDRARGDTVTETEDDEAERHRDNVEKDPSWNRPDLAFPDRPL